jgi:amino acid transporter/mannitol/fructose-specific phosphotransferase system IIA component (Ntr-type)
MKEGLKEELALLDIFCIATGAMISSGLFILPGLAFAKAGPAVILSYIIAGLFCIPTLFSMSELTTAMPKAGGAYFYIMRGFGPLFGTIAGLSMWFSLSLKGSFALVGMGTYLAIVTDIPINVIAFLCCLVFVIINLVSTKEAGRLQVFMVVILLAILLTYILWGAVNVDTANLTPFFSEGAISIFATASFVFISYGGLVKVAALAEETKNPARNLPLGMILSLIVTAAIYALVIFVTIGVSVPETLKETHIPIFYGAGIFGGDIFKIVISIGAFLAFITTANSGIMTASRYPLGMSRDKLLPDTFQKVSAKFGTPYVSILFTGFFMILFIFLPLVSLVKVASSLLILLYIFANLTVILFRESKIQSYKPVFSSPLYPYTQIFGVLGGGFLLIEMGTFIVFLTLLFLALGFLWYIVYAKKRASRDSALIYFLEKLVAKDNEFASENILTELKDIVIKRDEVIRDKVHTLFEESIVLDIDQPLSMKDFFKRISNVLGKGLGLDQNYLTQKFVDREKEACTVMRRGLAIPHIIVEGENIFKILIARAKDGVIFPGDQLAHIIFVTVGSMDARNLHLKVLAAIAQITENPEFDQNWFEVTNKEELKHIILLAERRRG